MFSNTTNSKIQQNIKDINALKTHFQKVLSSGISPSSPTYGQLVMTNLEKVKEQLIKLDLEPIPLEDKKSFDILFEFWAHLIYIINHGKLTSTLGLVFDIIHQCVSMFSFKEMARFLLTIEVQNDLLAIYHQYIISCRETYMSICQLFQRYVISVIGNETFSQITLLSSNEIYYQYSKELMKKLPEDIDISLIYLIAGLSVVEKDILAMIDEMTESEFDASTTISHYNSHFLLDHIPVTSVKNKQQLEPFVPILLMYPNKFVFMIRFLPIWLRELELLSIPNAKIIRSKEYFDYKRWIYQTMGEMMRKFDSMRETKFLSRCIVGMTHANDISSVNEMIMVVKSNTNMFNLKQLTRMGRLMELVMDHYISLHKDQWGLFDNRFKIHDFIDIFELSVRADHVESLLKLFGLIYRILPYFVDSSRFVMLVEYLFNQRFTYFFFHWSDLVRDAFYHVILYRSLFVKQNHIEQKKLTSSDQMEYTKRKTEFYDAEKQDLTILKYLKSRMEMIDLLINSIDEKPNAKELQLLSKKKEFDIVNAEYLKFLSRRYTSLESVPAFVTMLDMTEE